jgi:hypothetical protein
VNNKMSLKAIIDLPDDWESGFCAYCEFSYQKFGDPDCYNYCSLHCLENNECKLKVVDLEGEIDL